MLSLIYRRERKMKTEAQIRAQKKWEKKAIIDKSIRLNRNTDADIIDYLAGANITSFQGYVKELIRQDIQTHRGKRKAAKNG